MCSSDLEYIVNRRPAYLEQGVRDYRLQDLRNQYLWPFKPFDRPSPIGHESHSYQNYGGTPYFHHGIDIRVPSGSEIRSSTGGTVVNIENYVSGNSLYWEVAVRDDEGFLWQYHHVDRNTIPQAIHDAYKNGTRISAGAHLGNVVYWPVQAYGMNFHHIHLNVLDGHGNFINPYLLLLRPFDLTPPRVMEIYFTRNEENKTISADALNGEIDIIAKVEDLMDGQPYQLTVYKLEYEIRKASGETVLPRTLLWQFDRLPGGSDINAHVHTFYKSSFSANGKQLSTAGNYSRREFYVVLTNHLYEKIDPRGCWNTRAKNGQNQPVFPDGAYAVTVHATDYNSNASAKTVTVQVKNGTR